MVTSTNRFTNHEATLYFMCMYAYKLPNGLTINAERLVEDVMADSDFPQTYLDIKTGALIEIPSWDSLGVWVKEVGHQKRYFLIERFTDVDKINLARDFVREVMSMDASKIVQTKATKILQTNNFESFKTFLMLETDGWIHGWDQYIADEAWEYVHEWLTNNPHIKIEAVFEGCGDCAICSAMKEGKGESAHDLLEAFKTEAVMQSVTDQLENRVKKMTDSFSEGLTPKDRPSE